MFRRNRGFKKQVFSRNVAGFLDTGLFTPTAVTVIDGDILIPRQNTDVSGTHLVKQYDVVGWSWSSDISVTKQTGGSSNILFTGAECFYIDQLQPTTDSPVHNGQAFLNVAGQLSATDLNDFPLRIVHRRQFSFANNTSGTLPQNNAEPFANAASLTPGFGTERHIRRRIRLRVNEGLFWRLEFYDLSLADATQMEVVGQLLGVVSFAVRT